MTDIRPFRIDIPEQSIADLQARLALTRFPEKETPDDWSQGVPLAYMQQVRDYWAERYDWRRAEARINAFAQFMTTIDGLDIHFVHVRSPVSTARTHLRTRDRQPVGTRLGHQRGLHRPVACCKAGR